MNILIHERIRFCAIFALYVTSATIAALMACKYPVGSWQFDCTGVAAFCIAGLAKLSPSRASDQ